MYKEFWGLTERPFENTADPRFIYYAPQHEEALSRLNYAVIEQKPAAVLTGIFGCGKTLILHALISSLAKTKYEISLVVNPNYGAVELLREIVYNLGIKDNLPTLKSDIMHLLLERLWHNADDGKHTVIIIDEAHLIEDKPTFEELRLLLNLQYKNEFLLTLILSGQPELKEKISDIKQLDQRIFIKCHLTALSREETFKYIQHRLDVAKATQKIFAEDALDVIYENSSGIPRRINQICSMALFIAFGTKQQLIDSRLINDVAQEYV